MVGRKNITVEYVNSNAAYDTYEVKGVDTVEEDGRPIYHDELRGIGSDEMYVLNQYSEE